MKLNTYEMLLLNLILTLLCLTYGFERMLASVYTFMQDYILNAVNSLFVIDDPLLIGWWSVKAVKNKAPG